MADYAWKKAEKDFKGKDAEVINLLKQFGKYDRTTIKDKKEAVAWLAIFEEFIKKGMAKLKDAEFKKDKGFKWLDDRLSNDVLTETSFLGAINDGARVWDAKQKAWLIKKG